MDKELEPKLQRLLEGLKAAGVQHGSRNKTVAEKVGYSENTVLKVLSGNTPTLSPRFSRAVCEAFKINHAWVEEGKEPVLIEEILQLVPHHGEVITLNYDEIAEKLFNLVINSENAGSKRFKEIARRAAEEVNVSNEASDAIAVGEAVRLLNKMPKSMQWRAVGMLEDMLDSKERPDSP